MGWLFVVFYALLLVADCRRHPRFLKTDQYVHKDFNGYKLTENFGAIQNYDRRIVQQQPSQYQVSTNQSIPLSKRNGLPDLPSISSLFGSETADGTKYTAFGCSVTMSKDKCKFTFVPEGDKCMDSLPLAKVFDKVLGEGKSNLKDLMQKYIPILIYNVKKFVLNKCTGEVEFNAEAREPFDILKDKLKVKDGKLKLELNYKELSLEKFGIDISGNIDFNGKSIPISFVKKKGSKEGNFDIKADNVKVSDFTSALSKKELEEEGSEKEDKSTASKFDVLKDVVIKESQISGSRSTDGTWELVLTGKVTELKGLKDFSIFVVVQKPADGPTAAAVVIEFKKINPAQILSALFKYDFSKTPFLKDVQFDVVLEAANNEIIFLKNEALNKILQKFSKDGNTIESGFKLKFEFPAREIIGKINGKQTQRRTIPEKINLQIIVKDGKLDFKFPDTILMDLANIAIALIPKLTETTLNKIMDKPPQIQFDTFKVDVKTGEVDVKISTKELVSIRNGLFKLQDVEFELTHKPNGGSWDFKIKAVQKIGKDGVLSVLVKKSGDEFEIIAKAASLTIKQLTETFSQMKDNEVSARSSLVTSALNFGINDLIISAKFGGGDYDFSIKGNPILFDWKGLKFEGFLTKDKEGRKFAFAILMENIRLDTIISKLIKKEFTSTPWISEVKASLLVSNTNSAKRNFKELDKTFEIKKGVFFQAEFTIPKDCSADKVCEIIKDKFPPDSKFLLKGEITSDGFELTAKYNGNVELGKNVILEEVALTLKAGLKNQLSLSGGVKIIDPPLKLKGEIGIGLTGRLLFSMQMIGMWEKPFGIQSVAFGDVLIKVEIEPALPIAAFELGGRLHLGKLNTDNVIKANLSGGFDMLAPQQSYFYTKINKLTIDSILKAFGVTLSLPSFLKDTGFPKGLLIAYSGNSKAKKIEHLNVEIQPGFKLSGTVNLLGLELKCDVMITFPFALKLDVEMSPVSIAKGVVQLKRSAKDQSNGPKVYVGVSEKEISFKINAYVSVFGISTDVEIDVSNKGILFYVAGNLFNVIEANVTITAPFGNGKLQDSQYTASACLSTSVGDVNAAAKDEIDEAAETTKQSLEQAEQEISNSGDVTSETDSKLNRWMKSLEEKQETIKRKSGKLEEINEFLDSPCVNTCNKVCLGGPSTKKDCKKSGFLKLLSCTVWDDCKTKIEDVSCLAKCKAKKFYYKGKALKKKVTMELLIKSINVIKKVIEMLEELQKKTEKFVEIVSKATKVVQDAAEAGKKVLKDIATYTRENIIDIKHICFSTSLEKAKDACFSFDVSVVLGGKEEFKKKLEACFNAGFIRSMAKAIGESVFPGIRTLKEKLSEAINKLKGVGKEKEGIKKLQDETGKKEDNFDKDLKVLERDDDEDDEEEEDDDGNGRDFIVEEMDAWPKSKQWAYILKQTYGDTPSVSIRDDLTMDAFKFGSPWAYSEGDSPFTFVENNPLYHKLNEESVQKEDIGVVGLDLLPKNCSVYSTISESLDFIAQMWKEENDEFKKELNAKEEGLQDVENDIMRYSVRGNFTEEQKENALFYLNKAKEGNERWKKNIQKQLARQDASLLSTFKSELSENIQSRYGKSLNDFLASAKKEATKRNSVPSYKANVEYVDQLTKGLLADNKTPLSSKLQQLEELRRQSGELRYFC